MRKIIAADLGDANIPNIFVNGVSPKSLTTLFWREQSTNPESTTVEIWKADDDTFHVFTGNFADGEWGQADVTYYNEYPTVQKALADVRAYFTLSQDEEPQEQTASSTKFKRLIQKA